ncbi:MAG: DMT family transporter [Patescibacteria group bacterium]
MLLSKTRQGELIILAEAVLWGAFPVLALLAYEHLSPIRTLAWSSLFAACFFAVLFCWQKRWRELLIREAWLPILMGTLISGILYYLFYFLALRSTTVGNAAIIAQMEIWFSLLFFGLILRKENYTASAITGALLMFGGVAVVLFPGKLEINIGDILILLAALIAPVSNNFQQKARKKVSAITLLFVRSTIATPFLFAFAGFWEPVGKTGFTAALPFLLVSGILLFGLSKIFWVEGIHRIPVAKAASLNTLVPVCALIYALLFLGEIPTLWQLAGLPLVIGGAVLITRRNFLHEAPPID